MTVKELMSQVDVNRVVDAFLLLDYHFSEDNYENTFFEKYEAIPKLRKIVEENIRLFRECVSADNTDPCTIFIQYNQDADNYEESWKKSFASFLISDIEVLPVIDKDFHLFDDLGEVEVTHYSFDHTPMKEMANYVIAEFSIKEIGKEICVAYLLSELFFWGAFPCDREKRVNKLNESLNRQITEEELVSGQEFDEKMKNYREFLLQQMSEDEREYSLAKERFEKETEEICMRYAEKVNDEIHRSYISAIRQEYKNRD